MWAQLVKARMKPGSEEQLQQAEDAWEENVGRGTDSGWVRSLTLRSADDPNVIYTITPRRDAIVPHIVSGITGTFGTITRPDGKTQITFDHRALYRYVGDKKPGDTLC